MGIRRAKHAVYDLKYHLVWIPKYRKRLLDKEVAAYLKGVFRQIAEEYEFRIDTLEVMEDHEHIFVISGTGDIIEPDDNIVAIGSGGPYALAAARALLQHTNMDAASIVKEALEITAKICIYTNARITIEEL